MRTHIHVVVEYADGVKTWISQNFKEERLASLMKKTKEKKNTNPDVIYKVETMVPDQVSY